MDTMAHAQVADDLYDALISRLDALHARCKSHTERTALDVAVALIEHSRDVWLAVDGATIQDETDGTQAHTPIVQDLRTLLEYARLRGARLRAEDVRVGLTLRSQSSSSSVHGIH